MNEPFGWLWIHLHRLQWGLVELAGKLYDAEAVRSPPRALLRAAGSASHHRGDAAAGGAGKVSLSYGHFVLAAAFESAAFHPPIWRLSMVLRVS
jgi:hypothetical protein